MRVISCQEQINRQLVVSHYENIQELASLWFLKLNLECQNIKMEEEHINIYFFFKRLCSKLASYNRITAVFFKKAAIIIA